MRLSSNMFEILLYLIVANFFFKKKNWPQEKEKKKADVQI